MDNLSNSLKEIFSNLDNDIDVRRGAYQLWEFLSINTAESFIKDFESKND